MKLVAAGQLFAFVFLFVEIMISRSIYSYFSLNLTPKTRQRVLLSNYRLQAHGFYIKTQSETGFD